MRLAAGGGGEGEALKILQRLRDICACAAMDKEWVDGEGGGGGGGSSLDVSEEAGVMEVLEGMTSMRLKDDDASDDAAADDDDDDDADDADGAGRGNGSNADADDDSNCLLQLPIPRAAATSSKIMSALALCKRCPKFLIKPLNLYPSWRFLQSNYAASSAAAAGCFFFCCCCCCF